MYEDRKMKKTISYDETNYGKLDKIRELITELANQRGMLDIEGFLKNTKGFDLTASWDNDKDAYKDGFRDGKISLARDILAILTKEAQ
jgi:hypothetical protein